mmetsp:Transcript_19799/g.55859  ORF Transcript_19799/g.55859 Transcript_19799/m.55859 type:complete len:319 (+) Transcript_19799:99-1055(+)
MPNNLPALVSVMLCCAHLYTSMATGAEEVSCTTSSEPGSCKTHKDSSTRVAAGAPGLVLFQGKYSASIDVAGKRHARASELEAVDRLACAPFNQWPYLDRVTCGNCQALVSTVPYNRCDDYCGSFGHICEAAAEEMNENCAVKRRYGCNQIIPGTSDMLCTCRRPSPGQSVPVRTTPAPICGGGRSCEHCNTEEPPRHAGCLIVRDGKMLAIRITYGSRKFDTPGGQSTFREPPSCTAHRETYEDTGYEVTPTELLARGLHGGGFNLYRCELLQDQPTKGHDTEISGVHWLTKEEVQERVDQDLWRSPEAKYYVQWMR